METPLYGHACATTAAASHAVEYVYEVRTSPGSVGRAADEVRRLLAERAAAAAGVAGCAELADVGSAEGRGLGGAQEGQQRQRGLLRRALRPGGRGSTSVVAVKSSVPDEVVEGAECALLDKGKAPESYEDAWAEDADDAAQTLGSDEDEVFESAMRVDGSPPLVTTKKRKRDGFEAHLGRVPRTGPDSGGGGAFDYVSTQDEPLGRSSGSVHNPLDAPAAFEQSPGKTLSPSARSADPTGFIRARSSLVCTVVRGALFVYSDDGPGGGSAGANLGDRVLHSLVSDVNGSGMRPAGGSVAELRMVPPVMPSGAGSAAAGVPDGAISAGKLNEGGGGNAAYVSALVALAVCAVLLAGLFVRTGKRKRSESDPRESATRRAVSGKALDPRDDDDSTQCDVSDEADGVVTTTTRSHRLPAAHQGWVTSNFSDLFSVSSAYTGWVTRAQTRDAGDRDDESDDLSEAWVRTANSNIASRARSATPDHSEFELDADFVDRELRGGQSKRAILLRCTPGGSLPTPGGGLLGRLGETVEGRRRSTPAPPPGTRWRSDAGRPTDLDEEDKGGALPPGSPPTLPNDGGGDRDGLPAAKKARRSSLLGALRPPSKSKAGRREEGGENEARKAAAVSGRYFDITSTGRSPPPPSSSDAAAAAGSYGQEVDSEFFFGSIGQTTNSDEDVGLVSGAPRRGPAKAVRAALGLGRLGVLRRGGNGDAPDDESDFSVDLDVMEVREVQTPRTLMSAPTAGAQRHSAAAPGRGGGGGRDLASPLQVARGTGPRPRAAPGAFLSAPPAGGVSGGDAARDAGGAAGTAVSAIDACDVGGIWDWWDQDAQWCGGG